MNIFRTRLPVNPFIPCARRTMRTRPSVVSRILNTLDTNTTSFSKATADPKLPLKVNLRTLLTYLPQGHAPVEIQNATAEYNVTKLANGFTVLTESPIFPGTVNMGFLMDVGT